MTRAAWLADTGDLDALPEAELDALIVVLDSHEAAGAALLGLPGDDTIGAEGSGGVAILPASTRANPLINWDNSGLRCGEAKFLTPHDRSLGVRRHHHAYRRQLVSIVRSETR
ncbi:hypothetical protein [Streptomyces sp. sk226]|uniref:hypothetical protein n=1 Tax=Streptomyces sp. sk226 TaxID=2034268 RepID=UPI00118569A1|nr:hypothetical protein [Streptomyces sp. sk226]